MPIDSTCSGCGKTLRVNDEFVGRKARCPVCGTVYMVTIPNTESTSSLPDNPPTTSTPTPTVAETVYTPSPISNSAMLSSSGESWQSLPTALPLETPSTQSAETQPATAQSLPSAPIAAPSTRYFVRTPNSMVYGPSSIEVVNDWIREGRLDDTCHVREESSEQWLGIPAWRFQTRMQHNPMANPAMSNNQFGSIPVSTVQSVGYSNTGNGSTVLILGLVSWLLCFTFFGAIVCAILAIVFAMTELKKIRQGQSPSKEKTIVLIGLWLGIANLATWCLGIFSIIAAAILSP